MTKLLRDFLTDKSGATAIEYGLIGVLLSTAIIVGAGTLGSALNDKFSYVATYALGDGTLGQ